ncbi:MAG: hypothetical protein GY847_38185 [Proteobacteria bacterium]|nr:hypothetical protein [Pseudomonadota bacterium]
MTRTASLLYRVVSVEGGSDGYRGKRLTTTTNYYDVVVMGMELGPLAAGALLARRGFRVLVVGQSDPTDRYLCFNHMFTKRPFLFTSAGSPAVRRVISELTMGQLFQHAVNTSDPAFQIVFPRARLDIYQDPELTKAEIYREFPDAASVVDQTFEKIGRINGEIDKLIANDIVIPPESFLEKREFARAEVQNPFRAGLHAEFDVGPSASERFNEFLSAPVRFESAGASSLPPLVQFRQISGWLFDCQAIEGGRDGLRALLTDQIVGQGGDQHLTQQVAEIGVRKGRVVGVRMAGREEMTGCQVVLTDLSAKELAPLVQPSEWNKRFHALINESSDPTYGYAVNLGVDPEVVPAGLRNTAFVSFGHGLGDELLRIEQVPQKDNDMAALHVSCVVPPGDEETIQSGALRDAILDRMRWLVPFLDNHLRVIHSPFDGFGSIDLRGDAKGDVPPVPHPEEVPKWRLRPPCPDGVLGIENLPYRAGIKGLLMAGEQVISGLGAEGELVAAWGAARIASKMDPRRERLVRSMRSKVEM